MADDELETGRPPQSTRKRQGQAPIGPSQAITLFISLMLVGLIVCSPMQNQSDVRMLHVVRPVETVQRLFERNLWIEEAIDDIPAQYRRVARILVGDSEPMRPAAIAAFDEVLQQNGYPARDLQGETKPVDPQLLDGLRARRAVLLLEANRNEEARVDMQRLSASGHAAFVEGLKLAFSTEPSTELRNIDEFEPGLAGDDWIGTMLRVRLERATNAGGVSGDTLLAINTRQQSVFGRVVLMAALRVALLLAGFIVILSWLVRNRPAIPSGGADIPPVWTFESGYSTAVRVAFAAIAVQFVVTITDAGLGQPLLRVVSATLCALPLLWLVRRRLLRPLGATFDSAFGLSPFVRPLNWIGVALAVHAIQWLGVQVLVDGLLATGVKSHWSGQVDSIVLWVARPLALVEVFDVCVVAPIAVELGLRGLMFLTLRRHYGAWQSALFSSLLFAAAQFDSMPGMVATAWVGFVYAMTYERTRSLVPNIAAGMLAGALAYAHIWAFWR
ncbi:MAG: CPBP family intramembrane metalloprotease [Planctomycetes bacterium]|nr:CPBP family intramembrane metalloprotease [Planctomycetota bacterium]